MMLPDSYKREFNNKQLATSERLSYIGMQETLKRYFLAEYTGIDDRNEREIFERVQLGMALTPAERLQGLDTPWAIWVRALVLKHLVSKPSDVEQSLGEYIKLNSTRGKAFQSMMGAVWCIHNLPNYSAFSGLQANPIKKLLEGNIGPEPRFMTLVDEVFAAFLHIAQTPEYNMAFTQLKQRVAPIEFVYIG